MRWLVGVLLVCACSKKTEPLGDAIRARVPKVESATVLATPPATDKVPIIAFIDDAGALGIAVAPESWPALGEFQPPATLVTTDPQRFWPVLYEDVMIDRSPRQIVEAFKEYAEDDHVDLALLEDEPSTGGMQDDPPPPEEDDKPDDGEDESGGTGSALEEGKMGKKDSDRAEGAYKMKKADPAEGEGRMKKNPRLMELEREHARERAMPGPRGRRKNTAAGEPNYPARVSTIAGAVEDASLPMPHQKIAIAARPGAKASVVIDALTRTQAALLVARGADVRPLRLLFGPATYDKTPQPAHWIEVRLTAKEILVESVPAKPVVVQAAALAATYKELAGKDELAARRVDVLVAPDVDTQRLVDVLVALDAGGARSIALGLAPAEDSPQAKLRGQRILRFQIGRPNVSGALDQAIVKRVVSTQAAKLRACFEAELATTPDLTGTVQAQLAIDPKGKVIKADASGVSAAIDTCVTNLIKTLKFEVPPGTGMAIAVVPLTMR